MGSLAFGVLLLFATAVLTFVPFQPALNAVKKAVMTAGVLGGLAVAGFGAMSYNDAGYCQHIRTITGQESSTCKTGWYFLGWGASTPWPHFITVAHTMDPDAEGSSLSGPYPVRLADNWNGVVTQTTRFGIPQDNEQFIKMARDFRSPERLITTTLRPAVTASLDSTANLFSMEEYYAGGKRDAFKTEFRDAVVKGRAKVRQVSSFVQSMGVTDPDARANDLDTTSDGASVGEKRQRRIIMQKVLVNGNEVREVHGYSKYGIVVSSAILENLDPDDRFEEQIQARKDAASRRIVAQEERREQEEQRLLAIQRGKTDVATRQAKAEVEQIEMTTNAETKRQLAVIAANLLKEEAEIAKQTAEINLEKARVEAETKQTLADANAYEKRVILEADNALQQKLDAWVEISRAWAESAAQINVPETVFMMGGDTEGEVTTGNYGSVEAFMSLMTVNAARQLDLDPSVAKKPKAQ